MRGSDRNIPQGILWDVCRLWEQVDHQSNDSESAEDTEAVSCRRSTLLMCAWVGAVCVPV